MSVNMRGRVSEDGVTLALISQLFPDADKAGAFAAGLAGYGITTAVKQHQSGGFCVVGKTANAQSIQSLYNPQTGLYVFPDVKPAAVSPVQGQFAPAPQVGAPAASAPSVSAPMTSASGASAPAAPVPNVMANGVPSQPIRGKTVVCGKCGKIYSKSAKVCPSCGAKNKKPFYSKWWFWAIIGIVVIFIIIPKGGKDAEDISDPAGISSSNKGGTSENDSSAVKNEEITFSQLTAIDNDICSFVVTGIDPDATWGYTLKVLLENKSSDRNLMFSVTNASINGVNLDPLFATDVAAGKKSNNEINFSRSSIKEYGLLPVTDIELVLRVHDNDDWSIEDYAEATVHVYPYGEDKAVQFVRESQPNDRVIVDNEYVTAIITGIKEDDIWGYTLNLYLVNKTDNTVMFSVENASVNGFMSDPFFASSVTAKRSKFSSISWSDSSLEESGITNVEEIEFTFEASNYDDWSAQDYFSEIVTINP